MTAPDLPTIDGVGPRDGAGSQGRDEALQAALLREREAVERLEKLERSKADFVTAVSHELRTPLTSVLGYAEMLTGGEAGDLSLHQTHLLQRVELNGRRLLETIEDLLNLSRSEAEETHVSGACDAAQLGRAVAGLLTDAVDLTPDGGRVTISLERRGDCCEVRVADTGLGIAGTGFGPALVRSIVAAQTGTVTVASEPGAGTLVTICPPSEGPDDDAAPAAVRRDGDVRS